MNYLGLSPGQSSLLSSSYGSSNLGGSSNSISNVSISNSNLHLSPGSSYNNLNHSSSTGNIPTQVRSDSYQNVGPSYQNSPNQNSGYFNPVSPMNIDGMEGMELDNFTGHGNDLNWLNLSVNSSNASSQPMMGTNRDMNYMHQQDMMDHSSRTHQNSMYGSHSPRPHDEYSTMFDMETTSDF